MNPEHLYDGTCCDVKNSLPQVDMRAGCLNSNDCFVVATPQLTYVWCGKGSTGDEREMAKSLGASKGETLMVSEGKDHYV